MERAHIDLFIRVSLFGLLWWKNLKGICKLLHKNLPIKEEILKQLGRTFISEVNWTDARSLIVKTGILIEKCSSRKMKTLLYQTNPDTAASLYFFHAPNIISAILKFGENGLEIRIKAGPSTDKDVQYDIDIIVINNKKYHHRHSSYCYWPKDCFDECPIRKYLDPRYAVVMYPFFLSHIPQNWYPAIMKIITDLAPLKVFTVVPYSPKYVVCSYGHPRIGTLREGATWDCKQCQSIGLKGVYEYTGDTIRSIRSNSSTIFLGKIKKTH